VGLTPGQRVGNYEVLAPLGEGGMASVWTARHVHLESRHALKVLDPALLASRDLRARFLNEGRIQAQIRHPNLVAVTDVVIGDGLAVLVMDFAPGESLRERLDAGWRATPDEALAIVLPVLDGLAYAHEHGVVHRDIKPSNIVLGEGPRGGPMPRLIDFGVAKVDAAGKVATSGAKGATRTGARIGTTEYMAPEQVRGLADLDARADLYAVGITLFELLTGRTPFEGKDDFELMKAIVEAPPPDVRAFNRDVPTALAHGIATALNKQPADRHASADAMAAALQAPVRRATDAPAAVATAAAPAPPVPTGLKARALAGKAPWWFVLGSVIPCALGSWAAYELLYTELSDPFDHVVPLGIVWPILLSAPLWLTARSRWLKTTALALVAGLLEFGGKEGSGAFASLAVVALALPDQPRLLPRIGQALLTAGLGAFGVWAFEDAIDDTVAHLAFFMLLWAPGMLLLTIERWLREQTKP